MAISTYFQDEIDEVDATKTLTFVVDAVDYELFEWSYDGLEVTGGSDLACEYGASELLEAMGFRWYVPDTGASGNQGQFIKRPVSIPTNLTAAKQSYWMPNNNVFLVYGHSWAGTHAADRTTLNDAWAKFQTLHGVLTATYPAGHRWSGIVAANLAYFQANPQLVLGGNPQSTGSTFDLSVTGTDYDNLVEICAAQLLEDGLNIYNRTHFDPADGDLHTSDQVVAFTNAVGARVRSGTVAIGDHPARTGVSDATLGIYAYSGHRSPPETETLSPHYAQVALGFNNTSLSYQDLVEAWGAKSSAIMLREYWDTQVWFHGRPLANGRTKTGYFDRYDDFVSAGVIGYNAEFGANWLVNLVMFRYGVRKAKTGAYTYEQALDDVMADIFDDDPAVRDLYEYWSNPGQGYHKWGLRSSFDIIVTMVDGWYKSYFEQLMVILYEDLYLPEKGDGSSEDPYRAAISSLMSKVTAVRLHDITHSYAWIRQRANSNLDDYPDLKFSASPEPDWFANPVAPTHDEFTAAHTAITADTVRDEDLDSDDLVLVRGITPQVTATSPATKFMTIGAANYKFIGPGSVTFIESEVNGLIVDGGETVSEIFPAGIHTIVVTGSYLCSYDGGHLFLDCFPIIRKEADGTGLNHWLYIPTRLEGLVDIEADSRITIFDQGGRLDVLPEDHVDYASPANLGPGQVRVDNGNTRGFFYILGANRYMSMHPTVALLPRAIAEEDFPARCVVNVN